MLNLTRNLPHEITAAERISLTYHIRKLVVAYGLGIRSATLPALGPATNIESVQDRVHGTGAHLATIQKPQSDSGMSPTTGPSQNTASAVAAAAINAQPAESGSALPHPDSHTQPVEPRSSHSPTTTQRAEPQVPPTGPTPPQNVAQSRPINTADTVKRMQTSFEEFRMAERYLGLRKRVENQPVPSVNLSLHAPNPFEGDVIFVSIDLEKLGEFVPRDFYPMIGCITEIGIATLDSRDLRQTAPGVDAANWREYITKKQIEVTDTRKFRSIWRKGKLNTLPYRPTPVNRADISSCLRTELKGLSNNGRRNIVLVGHALAQDLKSLDGAHFVPTGIPYVISAIDTQRLAWAWRFQKRQKPIEELRAAPLIEKEVVEPRLEDLLAELGLDRARLYNSGIDAWRTLEAMLVLASRSAMERRLGPVQLLAGLPTYRKFRNHMGRKNREELEQYSGRIAGLPARNWYYGGET